MVFIVFYPLILSVVDICNCVFLLGDAKSGLAFSLDTLGMGFLKQDELFEILINKFPRERRDRWWGTPGMLCGVGGIVPAGVQGTQGWWHGGDRPAAAPIILEIFPNWSDPGILR